MYKTRLSYTSKGTMVCKFTVACNRFFKQDVDGRDGKEKAEAAATDEPAAGGQAQEESELKEAANF